MPSKVFGPTDSVADTLTQVGSTYQLPPTSAKQWIIYKALVAKGNVVNAKQNAGFIHIETTKRSYDFAYGGGIGGATNSHAGPAEPIAMCLPAEPNTSIKVYVLDDEVAKDVTVSLAFAEVNASVIGGLRPQNPDAFKTLAAGGVSANADTVADTEESFTVSAKLLRATLQPETDGKIYQIRIAGAGVVDAKAASGLIKIYVPSVSGPFEYAFGNGPAGATLGGPAWADVIDIPEGIPIKTNATVDVKVTTAEVMKSPVISLSYW